MTNHMSVEELVVWDDHWLTPFLKWAEEDVAAACGRIKALVDECVAGRFVGIDADTVATALAPLEAENATNKWLVQFFAAVGEHTRMVTQGTLAPGKLVAAAAEKANHVLQIWPESGDVVHGPCGLDDPRVKAFVQQI